jgi:hypothetical protein
MAECDLEGTPCGISYPGFCFAWYFPEEQFCVNGYIGPPAGPEPLLASPAAPPYRSFSWDALVSVDVKGLTLADLAERLNRVLTDELAIPVAKLHERVSLYTGKTPNTLGPLIDHLGLVILPRLGAG